MKGVKLSIVHETVTYSVELDGRRTYCSRAKSIPVGWEKMSVNGKLLQRMKGHRLEWTLKVQNSKDGDDERLKRIILIINLSRANGTAITLYPRWDSEAAENDSYQVLCREQGEIGDISNRVNIAQMMKGVVLCSVGLHKDES